MRGVHVSPAEQTTCAALTVITSLPKLFLKLVARMDYQYGMKRLTPLMFTRSQPWIADCDPVGPTFEIAEATAPLASVETKRVLSTTTEYMTTLLDPTAQNRRAAGLQQTESHVDDDDDVRAVHVTPLGEVMTPKT